MTFLEGAAAPPRSNGELVFAAPWESRAFAMGVALSEAGVFTWPQFQAALISQISRWESAHRDEGWCYYEHWLGAIEQLLTASGTVLGDEVGARAVNLAQRSSEHDHAHG
ncbi:nitrile hydratase accessory protein [Mycobacteriaceae bacterium 1482268.1]|nr:nitrile hydratase accessory protein [Mycobacteriaceae bacterium 1482268.1]